MEYGYKRSLFPCAECDGDTDHIFYNAGHERDGSYDWYQCQKCGLYFNGYTGQDEYRDIIDCSEAFAEQEKEKELRLKLLQSAGLDLKNVKFLKISESLKGQPDTKVILTILVNSNGEMKLMM